MLEFTVAVIAVAVGLATIGAIVGAIALSELLLVCAGSAFVFLVTTFFGDM